jgi:hypothetical protein
VGSFLKLFFTKITTIMKDCGKCIHHAYSGGQQGLASGRGVAVETLCYVFCKHEAGRDHVFKTFAFGCNNYSEKGVQGA